MSTMEVDRRASEGRWLIVAARFNRWISGRLVDGARRELAALGAVADHIDLAWVPGAFELPLAARTAAATGHYRGVVCVGAIIRGGTDHHTHIGAACASGIAEAGFATGIPVTFGVITADSFEAAAERSSIDGGRNIGSEAASAAVEQAAVLDALRRGT